MGDSMRPVPFKELIRKIILEQEHSDSVFCFPLQQLYHKNDGRSVAVFSRRCDTPVGPAAGPHTQLAQNIIVSFLAGGRFMELKTVQKLDTLKIEKPCIDARDEGYNVEWSSEFTLEQSFDEYLKAWFALHMLESMEGKTSPTFIFNMSVGYDLEGIKTQNMQKFIDSMIDASSHELFSRYSREMKELVSELNLPAVMEVSPNITPAVSISTMHGCPPEEIEAICRYMLTEKKLDTFVKLNPTLLGYERVREMLDSLGYDYIGLTKDSFDHDLGYGEAVSMLSRLQKLAEEAGRGFGIKLSNTLGTVNNQGRLPGREMYMSGRALYPLAVTLAYELSAEFEGTMPVSYSGGASAANVAELFNAGIHPITAATELLKPSGYLRLLDLACACDEAHEGWSRRGIDVDELRSLSEQALISPLYRKDYRGDDEISVSRPLPMHDCYIAPCVAACPISQDVPEYVHLAGQGEYEQAIEMVCLRNPLPNIMGYICDHQCMYNCTRRDYEGAVQIRELKRIAAEKGMVSYQGMMVPGEKNGIKAAVIGSGPAGLSAAYYLARSAFDVTVFERESRPGGIVQHVIPDFRFPQKAIDADISLIESWGVSFVYDADTSKLDIGSLKKQGFSYIIYAVGAEKNTSLPLESCTGTMVNSLEFLRSFRKHGSAQLGEHVVVVGGGNTAMDSARAAASVPGVKSVTVVYRRTLKQMPADLEEYENALSDGVVFRFLANPVSLTGKDLLCRIMELGENDESGRQRPVETEETFTITCDTLITAVGEKVDIRLLESYGMKVHVSGSVETDPETLETSVPGVYLIGDAQSGPATVVRCAAAAWKAFEHIRDDAMGPQDPARTKEFGYDDYDQEEIDGVIDFEYGIFSRLTDKKAGYKPQAGRGVMDDDQLAEYEASRCLDCSTLCNKCVDVCPNRANVPIDVRKLRHFADAFQIVHLDGYCNECGNCEVFCPWEGKPYTDKLTIFSTHEDFLNSSNTGFSLEGSMVNIREQDQVVQCRVDELENCGLSEDLLLVISHVIHEYPYLVSTQEEDRR